MQETLGIATPEIYAQQFDAKVAKTREELSSFSPPELTSFNSPEKHFRMRAEFKVWHENGVAHYAMYKPGEYKKPVCIEEFSIGSESICQLMPPLLTAINDSEIIRRKLFQVEFLTTTTGESLITLIYHKALDSQWEEAAGELEEQLNTKIIGRSRKQKVVLSNDFVTETMLVNDKAYHYQQVETGFTQPNAHVCQKMLNWAQDVSKEIGGDLLELYCGNGNFTIPLAENFNKVLATEVSKTSVNSAKYNITLNKVENIEIARMSSEEFTQAMNGEREFRRLKDIDLASYSFSTVFVDPPRAGLDKDTEKMICQFDNILYISCNPETLRANLDFICKTHDIKALAFFDQFPYTEHRECGVLLSRKEK